MNLRRHGLACPNPTESGYHRRTDIKKGKFGLFGIEGSFEGFTNGDRWNGWECPHFTLEEGLRFVEAWKAPAGECGRGPAVYDSENDFFEFTIEGGTDRFGPEIVEGMKLYPIGAYGWCWEDS